MGRRGVAFALQHEKTPSRQAPKQAEFVDGLNGAELIEVPLSDIDLNDETFQYRVMTKSDDLRAALARDGQLEPVDLVGAKPYRIIDGFRRVRAIKEMGWQRVRALVHGKLPDDRAHERAFAKNVVRKNLSPIDRANAIHLAKQRGMRPAAIASAFGLSDKQVARYVALLSFPKALQVLVDGAKISMAHAKLLHDFDVPEVADWADRINKQEWTSVDLRRALRKERKSRGGSKRRVFLKRDGNTLRVYSFRIRKDAKVDDVAAVLRALKEAIAFLGG